ncbi:CHAT domain-containing protein [Sorangium cellulosum]|uniref:CHAT domain-containing protein n=1 Tax=Sorangium cellulosum TaxID=56 RepID=UPI001F1B0952|nr:CHAT domain-containing protein [Sorangium cellulosum]
METSGEDVRIAARGSRGERPAPHKLAPELGIDALTTLASKVGRAVRARKELEPAALELAQAIHAEIVKGELRDILARMTDPSRPKSEDPRENRLLVRLYIQDHALMSVPWEALCKPGTTEGFWGTDPHMLVARGVSSSDPWAPREVTGAVRVLAIAPGSNEQALLVLREALAPSIDAGEIEWLDPIAGPDISSRNLYDKLRRGKAPHIIHWLGHGGLDVRGRPSLRVADDEDGEEVWITAEAFARELSAHFYEELRLVILEACEGAKAGMFGSAADVLAKAGADAVVAHLWPVKADVARACSAEIYRSLTAAGAAGDIGASVAAARRTLLAQSAEAFSPILYLRSSDSVIFNFARRKVSSASGKRRAGALAPALHALLDRPPYTLVICDVDEDRVALKEELTRFMEENDDRPDPSMSLSAMTQRCMLRFGEEVLHSLFQQAISGPAQERPPLIDVMGGLVPPGVHITLLWRPYLEHAIAARQPGRTIYAIQVSLMSHSAKPRIVKRAAGATGWKMDPTMPKRFDVDNDIVVLRMYGGYSPELRPIFSQPVLTEDDHISGLLGGRPPQWLEELLSRPRIQPGLFLWPSVLDWRNRLLLRWLYDQRPFPKDSLVILRPDADPREPEIWDSGGGLPGAARVASITEDPVELARAIEAFAPEAPRR